MLFVQKDKGNGNIVYEEAPLRDVTEDIQVMPHPNGSGIILIIAGVRCGIPAEQARKLPQGITEALDAAQPPES